MNELSLPEDSTLSEMRQLERIRPLVMGALCVLSGLALIIPQFQDNVLVTSSLKVVATRGFLFLGSLDFLFGFLVFLSLRPAYTMIRIRCGLGAGFIIYSYYTLVASKYVLPAIALSHLSFFLVSVLQNTSLFRIFSILGVISMITLGIIPYWD